MNPSIETLSTISSFLSEHHDRMVMQLHSCGFSLAYAECFLSASLGAIHKGLGTMETQALFTRHMDDQISVITTRIDQHALASITGMSHGMVCIGLAIILPDVLRSLNARPPTHH